MFGFGKYTILFIIIIVLLLLMTLKSNKFMENFSNNDNNKSNNEDVKKQIDHGEQTITKGLKLISQIIEENLSINVKSKELVDKLKIEIEGILRDISGIIGISIILSMMIETNKMQLLTESSTKFVDAVFLTQTNIINIKQSLGLKDIETNVNKHTELINEINIDFMAKISPIISETGDLLSEVIVLSLSQSVTNPIVILNYINIALNSMTDILKYSMIMYISNPLNKIEEMSLSDRLNFLQTQINNLQNKLSK